jgi:hypothetical protein
MHLFIIIIIIIQLNKRRINCTGPSSKPSTNTRIHKYSTVTQNINKTKEKQYDEASVLAQRPGNALVIMTLKFHKVIQCEVSAIKQYN